MEEPEYSSVPRMLLDLILPYSRSEAAPAWVIRRPN